MSYTKFVFWADRKTKIVSPTFDWLRHSHPLLWTAEWYLTKLDRKQELDVLNQVCVSRGNPKTKITTRPLIGWNIFDFSETTEWNVQNVTKLDRKQEQLNVLYQVCVFSGQDGRPAFIGGDIFDFFETAEWKYKKTDRNQELNV